MNQSLTLVVWHSFYEMYIVMYIFHNTPSRLFRTQNATRSYVLISALVRAGAMGAWAPVLIIANSFEYCWFLKKSWKWSIILAFQWSWHPSCENSDEVRGYCGIGLSFGLISKYVRHFSGSCYIMPMYALVRPCTPSTPTNYAQYAHCAHGRTWAYIVRP